jgi:geranylgeranyl diphosphate synthase type I
MSELTAPSVDAQEDPLEQLWPRSLGTPSLRQMLGSEVDDLLNEVLSQTVTQPLWTLMDRGGKRWRPIISRSSYLACGGKLPAPEAVFHVVELLHNGSLVVDDIQDVATERRGAPPIHHVYGLPVALNAANGAYFRALAALKDILPDGARLRALDMLSQELFNAHLGQALDLALGKALKAGKPVRAPHYRVLAAAKTGALVRMAARLGAIAANASDLHEQMMARWAEGVGLAYQIRDDVEDVEEGLSDIAAGRITLPLLLTMESVTAEESTLLFAHFGTHELPAASRDAILALMKKHDVVERGRQQARDAAQASNFALNALPPSADRDFLKQLTLKLSGV